ncbi:Zn-finger protein, partial [Globisporangium splendens]
MPPPDNNADAVRPSERSSAFEHQQRRGGEEQSEQQSMRKDVTNDENNDTVAAGGSNSVFTSDFVVDASALPGAALSPESAVKMVSPLAMSEAPSSIGFVEVLNSHDPSPMGMIQLPVQLGFEWGKSSENSETTAQIDIKSTSPKRERETTDSSQHEDSSDSSSTKKVFKCTFPGCGKEFHLKGNLKRHLNIHNGDKKFKCKFCGKDFLRKADMEVHHRVHTGEKPYQCKFAECDKSFARRSDLLSHERTHVGTKPFACLYPGCGRHFARKFDLQKHQRMHDNHSSECQKKRKISSPSSDDCSCWSAPQEETAALSVAVPSIAPASMPANAQPPLSAVAARYQLTCTEDHVHSPPACFASFASVDSLDSFLLSQESFDMKRPGLETNATAAGERTSDTTGMSESVIPDASKQDFDASSSPFPTFTSAVQITGTPSPPQVPAAVTSGKRVRSSSPSGSCPMDAGLLQDYSKHNSQCGHLSILHGNHRDYVVKNHLVCQNRVKSISGSDDHAASAASARCVTDQEPHRPGCGHLPVRHKDHIDYVVEDNLFCQHAGLLEGADNIELLDDDFWDFYGAIGSMNTDDV